MFGSPKQIDWANSIQQQVVAGIQNNFFDFPLPEKILHVYETIDNASWWINTRKELCSKDFIMVFGLVALAQDGDAEACDEVIKWQDDPRYAQIFDQFKVQPETE